MRNEPQPLLVSKDKRVSEHKRVDAEIQKSLSMGWNPDDWTDSLKKYSAFLYTEVQYDFLHQRVRTERKRQQSIIDKICERGA